MQVGELIQRLQEYEELYGDEAEVFIMMQESWPFECDTYGIISREEMRDKRLYSDDNEDHTDDCDWRRTGKCVCGAAEEEPEEPWTKYDRFGAAEYQLPKSDIFIVEGSQRRYGSKEAWDC